MGTNWYWPTDERRVTNIMLGPYNYDEAEYATWLVQFFPSLPAHIQDGLLALVRRDVRALVYFMCADR
jgi:hypothetical protein